MTNYTASSTGMTSSIVTLESVLATVRDFRDRQAATFRKTVGDRLTVVTGIDTLSALASELDLDLTPGPTDREGRIGGLKARAVSGVGVMIASDDAWKRLEDPFGWWRDERDRERKSDPFDPRNMPRIFWGL